MSTAATQPEDEFVEPPRAGDAESNRWVVLVIVCLAQFMVVLDATVVNVALPSIQTDLGFSAANLQWVINAYTLVFGGFLLLGGRAGDLFGRRRLFLAGVAIFSAASLLNGLATSEAWLVGARALQGLGGALVSPAALSIITTTFAEGEERTKALGVWSAIAAGGGAFGLLLGGILTDLLSWEWIFFVNVPIGLATAALAIRYVPESRAPNRPDSVDLPGAVSVTAGLVVLVYAIVKAEDFGWGSAEDARPVRRRGRAPDRVRVHRAQHQGAADPARDLPGALARGREPDPAARDRRPVRVLLLQLALRAADPRLLAARGGPRVPAGDAGDRRRRRHRAAARQADRRPHHRRDRHADRRRSGCICSRA